MTSVIHAIYGQTPPGKRLYSHKHDGQVYTRSSGLDQTSFKILHILREVSPRKISPTGSNYFNARDLDPRVGVNGTWYIHCHFNYTFRAVRVQYAQHNRGAAPGPTHASTPLTPYTSLTPFAYQGIKHFVPDFAPKLRFMDASSPIFRLR
jgi:hypothetical protein